MTTDSDVPDEPTAPDGNGVTHEWRNRIVRYSVEDPATLLANPFNYRIHSATQAAAVRGSVREIGFVRPIIVNDRNIHIIDGHLRVSNAVEDHEPVAVAWVDLDEK